MSQRIYLLMGQVMDFQRAVDNHEVCADLWLNLREVSDHVIRIIDQVDAFRCLLQSALSVDATLTAQRQSEETRKLTETRFGSR